MSWQLVGCSDSIATNYQIYATWLAAWVDVSRLSHVDAEEARRILDTLS